MHERHTYRYGYDAHDATIFVIVSSGLAIGFTASALTEAASLILALP